MVSFQCDGCQDVVKKPKLDSHGARCHSSFTCIDCSSTFAGPAQWKSHTSCISEEQKYQKSLYQEPRGRGRGRGQRGRGGARGGFSRTQYIGSGENSIPLGPQTNAWTAPPPDPVNNAPFNSTEWNTTTEAQTDSAPANGVQPDSKDSEKSKKSKKRKAEEAELTGPPSVTPTSDESAKKKKRSSPPPEPEPLTEGAVDKKEKKKKKKSRGENELTEDGDTPITNGLMPNGKEKKSKKSHKSEVLAGEEPDLVPAPSTTLNGSNPTETDESPKKKKKSRKSEALGDSVQPTNGELVMDSEPATNGHSEFKKPKKNKKSKTDVVDETALSSMPGDSLSAPNDNDLIPVSTIDSETHSNKKDRRKKEKKEKKEKRSKTEGGATTTEQVESTQQTSTEPVTKEANGEVTPKRKKSKKDKKEKKGESLDGNGTETLNEPGAVIEGAPRSKRKSKRDKGTKEAIENA